MLKNCSDVYETPRTSKLAVVCSIIYQDVVCIVSVMIHESLLTPVTIYPRFAPVSRREEEATLGKSLVMAIKKEQHSSTPLYSRDENFRADSNPQ
jgi:hypothetical protein